MALAVLALAVFLRSDIACRPVTFDEADYCLAVARGLVANWLDRGDVNLVRHFHGPLLVYLIGIATAVGGWVEAWIRLPAVLASALACATIAVAAADLTPGTAARRLVVAGAAGLLLATAPASVSMSSSARPQAVVELLLVLDAWLLCRHLRRPTDASAIAMGAALGLQFTAMEYGYVAAAASVVAVALVRACAAVDSSASSRSRRHAGLAVAAAVSTVLVVWPPGILGLQSATNARYYVEYAERGQLVPFRGALTAHVPWWAYAYWYWTAYPAVLVFAAAAMGCVALWMWRARTVPALVTGTFAALTVFAVHRAHIMTMAYSCFAVPSVVLAGVLAMDWAWQAVPRAGIEGIVLHGALATVIVAAIVGGVTRPTSQATCTTDSALERVSRVIAREARPGDAVLATQWPIVHFVTELERGRHDVVVEAYDPTSVRRSRERLRDLEAGRFAWVLLTARTSSKFPDTPVLRYVSTRWKRVAEEGGNLLFHNPAMD